MAIADLNRNILSISIEIQHALKKCFKIGKTIAASWLLD